MSKESLLSLELTRSQALLSTGCPVTEVLVSLRSWAFRIPRKGSRRVGDRLIAWNTRICSAVEESLPLGAPVTGLLKGVHPFIRGEERQWRKLQALQRQAGFQGAIALVVPWAVAAFHGDLQLNPFFVAGGVCQVLGLVVLQWLVRWSLSAHSAEGEWLFDFLISAWMRISAGVAALPALRSALESVSSGKQGFELAWKGWLKALDSGAKGLEEFRWKSPVTDDPMPESADAALLVLPVIRSGAGAATLLLELAGQLEEARQASFEERIEGLPARISLVLCFLFTPAVFLILLGAMWPILSDLSM